MQIEIIPRLYDDEQMRFEIIQPQWECEQQQQNDQQRWDDKRKQIDCIQPQWESILMQIIMHPQQWDIKPQVHDNIPPQWDLLPRLMDTLLLQWEIRLKQIEIILWRCENQQEHNRKLQSQCDVIQLLSEIFQQL